MCSICRPCRAASLIVVSRCTPSSNLPARVLGWPLLGVLGRSLSAHVLEGETLRGRWGRRRLWRQTRRGRHIWLLCLRCLLHALGQGSFTASLPNNTEAVYSALMFAALMIGHHFSISAFCCAASASGVCLSRGHSP